MGALRWKPEGRELLKWRPWRICKRKSRASSSMGSLLGTPRGFVCQWLWETVEERCVNGKSFSTGTWKKGSFAGNSESYVKNVKDDSGNGTSPTVWRFCEKNLEVRLLYWRLWEICNRRLWKRSISLIGHRTGNKVLSKGRFVLFLLD
jgi:hypothetical protein